MLCVAADAATLVIENAQVGAEIDLDHGCSISGAWATGSGVNLVNTADLGRYIQVSYYSGPSGFQGCTWRGQDWAWNPIGAGDQFGNPAQVISAEKSGDGTSVTCSMRPIQWGCNNVLCDCTVDLVYRLDGNAIVANVALNNDRIDHTDYGPHDQELPAVYTNGGFYRLVGYTGASPCSGDPNVQEWNAGWDDSLSFPWVPGRLDVLTEPVLTLLAPNDFGLGVYSSAMEHFIAGFAGGEGAKGSGGTKDGQTGYIAPVASRALGYNERFEYTYAIVLGNLPDIRAKACQLAAAHARASNSSSAVI